MHVQINTLRKFLLHHATYTPAEYEVATFTQGIVVQIDESKFAKRKYHVRHRVRVGWVFGGREKDNKREVFMEPVEDRSAATFLFIIQK